MESNRLRQFMEDLVILAIIGIVLYFIVTFSMSFFKSNPINNENKIIVKSEYVVENNESLIVETNITTIQNENNITLNDSNITDMNTTINDANISENNETVTALEIVEEPIEEVITKVEVSVKNESTIKKKRSVNNFLYTIDKAMKSVSNIDNNSRKTKIRLTIMKDGKYQDFELISGDSAVYKKVQEAAKKVFPVTVPNELKPKFPRYLRMTFN